GTATQYTYDNVGNLTSTKTGLGQTPPVPAPTSVPPNNQAQYYDDAGRLIGVRTQSGAMISYDYDTAGRRIRDIQYAAAPQTPLWSQSFDTDASGITNDPSNPYSALPIDGTMSVQGKKLVVTSQAAAAEDWPTAWGMREHAFTDGVVFRGEVTTGSASTGRDFMFGATGTSETSTGALRRHAAYINNGDLYVSYYDGGWHTEWIGTGRDNTTYVVEVVTNDQGSTMYVYEKGKDRSSGVVDHRTYADWGVARLIIQTYVAPGLATVSTSLDNVSESTVKGPLMGGLIAAESAADAITEYFYDNSGRLIGILGSDGMLTGYTYATDGSVSEVRRYGTMPTPAQWSQDFSRDTSGLTSLPSGYMTLQGGRLVLTTQNVATSVWPTVWGDRLHALNEGVIFRAEVTTETSSGRYAIVGAEGSWAASPGTYRRHAAYFEQGELRASYYDNGFQWVTLGTAKDNTTYVVEVATGSAGTTLYVYEKGMTRESGYRDTRNYTDWNGASFMAQTEGESGRVVAKVYVDNVSESTAQGALYGRYVVAQSTNDVVATYSGNATLNTTDVRTTRTRYDVRG
ncbi:MAG: RHS repeat domain-containing protein, partial [Planctomycetota bacterium]